MIVLNASPCKNKNTATLLKEAMRGAEAAGAVVEIAMLLMLLKKNGIVTTNSRRTSKLHTNWASGWWN